MLVLTFIRKQPGTVLFSLALTVGMVNLDHYGMGWDEVFQREIGTYAYNYAFHGDRSFWNFSSRDYGVAFELPLIILEKILGLHDTRSVFLMRHLFTHVFFLTGALFCYKLVNLLYANKWLACTAFLLVIVSPRFYADSFTNTKDIPFLAMFFIVFYQAARSFKDGTNGGFILLGVLTGLMINLRVLGLMVPALVIFFMLVDGFTEKQLKRKMWQILLFISASLITLYASWPYLWPDPIGHLQETFSRMSKFDWNGSNLYNGKIALAKALDWDYVPTWFCVTIPVLYLALGFAGALLLLAKVIRRPVRFMRNAAERNNLYYILCFFAPVLIVILLHSVLYDGWRHLYFIYAPFVMLCIYCLSAFTNVTFQKTVLILTFGFMVYVAGFMVRNHPFENVYFNELVDTKTPEHLKLHYDLDYWGVSYRRVLEHILAIDTSKKILISAENDPGCFNALILPERERKRIEFMPDTAGATYLITNFRWHWAEYGNLEAKKCFSVKVGSNTINAAYKLR